MAGDADRPGDAPAIGGDSLLDSAPCGFVTFVDDGTITAVNATLLDVLGYERAELVGRHVESLFSVGSRIFYQTHLFPLVRMHGSAEEIFLLLRSRQGDEIGVLTNIARRERDGVVVNDCVFMRVRERQKYEEELLRARRTAEAARADAERRRAELEKANEQLRTQATELEVNSQQLQDQAAELEAASDELQAMNDQLLERTAELERLRALADRASRAKTDFLAVMSHELRTPLNAIAGYTQILKMGIHGPLTDMQRESLNRIERSQGHLLRLVNDALDLARIESGHVEYTIDDVPLTDLVHGITPMLDPQIAAKGLSFHADVPADLVARADRDKAQRIVLNLLGNAIKFTPAGGRIWVEGCADARPGMLRLQVSDTGPGIPPDRIEAVLEPFVRVHTGGEDRTEGTGLGLSISRDLARGMHGDLEAHSVVGEGSTFTLVLPAARAAAQSDGAAGPAAGGP